MAIPGPLFDLASTSFVSGCCYQWSRANQYDSTMMVRRKEPSVFELQDSRGVHYVDFLHQSGTVLYELR